MLALPNEILHNILSFADEKSIITLAKLSDRIGKLVDINFWLQQLEVRKSYDDYTYCFHHNNDEIHYHRSCIDRENIHQFPAPTLEYDQKKYYNLWNAVQDFYYGEFEEYCLENDMEDLILCFDWSMHKIDLFELFSTTPFAFYKVLLTALNWKESCRRQDCGNDAYIFSPFCSFCRKNRSPAKLLSNTVNVEGPFYIHPFDKLGKKFIIKYDNVDFHLANDGDYIVYLQNDIIYCVGRILNGTQNFVIKGDDIELAAKGFVRNDRYYDYIRQNPPNKEVNSNILNGTIFVEGFFQINDTNYIVELREDDIICIGKIENNMVVTLDHEELEIIGIMGLHCYLNEETVKIKITEINDKLKQMIKV